MKFSWQILTILLAVALVVLTVNVTIKDDKTVEDAAPAVSTEQVALENIMTRSSVRKYTNQKVEEDKIEKILRAAMAAPTAGNKQPWEFVVVTERETLDKFADIIPGAHMAKGAQLAIVVLGTPDKALLPDYWIQDCSAANENLLLAAHAMGLGAVWCGAFPENGSGKVEAMSKLLNLPEGTFALSVNVIGYPDAPASIKDKWDANKVHYNKY